MKAGQIVYNRQGHEAKYVARLSTGSHIVRPGQTCYSPDPDQGEYTVYQGVAEWPEVFLKPPVEKLNAEVAALNAKIEDLRKSVQVVMAERAALDRQMEERKARIARHEQLAQLDAFITGQITHFVEIKRSYGTEEYVRSISIKTFEDAMTEEGPYCSGVRLLSLFGGSKGDLTWRINRYCDGSGQWTDVVPCTSLEEAQAKARALYDANVEVWRTDPGSKNRWGAEIVIEHAKRLGYPIPQDALDTAVAQRREIAAKAIEAARKALLKAEGNLQALQRGEPVSDQSVASAPLPS